LAETYDSLYTYGKDMSANIRLENITSDINTTNFDVKIAGNIIKIKTSLRGIFNIYNILASI
jgi:UDP-N-acetylmuramyl tripeptide synthase